MTRGRTHTFDGQQMTVAQINVLLPEYKRDCLRDHLAAGRNTTVLIRGYRRIQPKPIRGSQCFRYGRKIPNAMGGPKPCPPTPVT
jgi:hypothetical protein